MLLSFCCRANKKNAKSVWTTPVINLRRTDGNDGARVQCAYTCSRGTEKKRKCVTPALRPCRSQARESKDPACVRRAGNTGGLIERARV